MTYNRFILVIFSAVIALCSCKKFLNKKPDASLIVPATLSDMQKLLDDDGTMNELRTPCYGEISSDDYFLPQSNYNASLTSYQYWYTWRNYFVPNGSNDWSAGYQPIYKANLVLDLIGDIHQNSINKADWNNVKGAALFFRSYYFLCLLWNYAKAYDPATADKDPGIVLRLTSNFNVKSVRATNQQSYMQVVNDALSSIKLLPKYAQLPTRPSKEAAYGLLARCYFSMRDYRRALLYADSCLQLNSQLMDYNGDDDIPDGINSSSPFKIFNKEIIFYSEMNTFYGALYKRSTSRIDTTLYSSYSDNDLRKVAYFKSNADGYKQFKGTYGVYSSTFFSGIATDEMYLIRSESYIRMGELQSGMDDLNKLLSKRYESGTFEPISIPDQNKALQVVLNERRKELVMRGLRWMDIKRLNKENKNIILKRVEDDGVYTLMPNDGFYALPIPDDIIELTGIPQNK